MDTPEQGSARSKKPLAWLVLILAALFLAFSFSGYGPFQIFFRSPFSGARPRLSEESLARIPPYFPRSLVLGEAPEVLNAREERDRQFLDIALYFRDPESAASSLAQAYERYASERGWAFQKAETSSLGFAVRMKRGVEEATIGIEPEAAGGILVNINYHVKAIQ